jgi:signal transduction histidine kinase
VRRLADQIAIVRPVELIVEGDAAIVADPARTRQILRNLLDNASRHGTPPVKVTISEVATVVRIVIEDSGMGVSRGLVASMFDRYRSGPNPDGLPTSTGIGLWLSKELATLMGGDLRHMGGSVFEVTLPAAQRPTLAAAS